MMKIVKWTFIIVFSFSGVGIRAQQDPQMSMQFFNWTIINAGSIGSGDGLCASLLGRIQWVGFEGNPQTLQLGIHANIPQIYGGVGLNVYYDKLGLESSLIARLGYAFRYKIGPGTIGIGFNAGIINKTLSNAWRAVDPVPLDAFIPDVPVSKMAFDIDIGIFYSTQELFAGFSVTHINAPQIKKVLSGGFLPDNFNFGIVRHYYLIGGYGFNFPDISLSILPSFLIKSDGVTTQFDINIRGKLKDIFWAGISYRFQDAIVPMLGIKYQIWKGTLMAGYSYDITTSLLRKYSSGSHEVGIRYCMPIQPQTKTGAHKTVRYL